MIIHAVPPLTDNWKIEAKCPCYDVMNGVSFSFSLSTYNYAVWNASATVDFTNGSSTLSELILYINIV